MKKQILNFIKKCILKYNIYSYKSKQDKLCAYMMFGEMSGKEAIEWNNFYEGEIKNLEANLISLKAK
jgi:hypothetical protein